MGEKLPEKRHQSRRLTFAQHSIKKEVFAEPGFFTFYYKVCSGATNCSDEIFCEIAIHYTLRAYNDLITAATNGAIIYNVLSNDQYYGDCSAAGVVPAVAGGNVTVTEITSPPNIYYSISTAGNIVYNLSGGFAPAGTYILSYKICDVTYPLICQTANVWITVPNTNKMIGSVNNNEFFDINKTIISPNPTNGKIVITFNTTITYDFILEVHDVVGRLIIEKQIPKDTLQYDLDLSNCSSANYFVKVYDIIKGTVFNKTIVKQ